MEMQKNPAKPIITDPKPSLGILGILCQAFKTSIRNGKLVLSLSLLMFLSFSLLSLVNDLVSAPILTDMSSKAALLGKDFNISEVDQTITSGIMKDSGRFLALELAVLVFSCVMLLFFSVAMISSSYEAYTAKVLTLKDMLLRVRERWMRPIITSFYMTLISLSMSVGLFILLVVNSAISQGVSSIILISGTVLLGASCYVYVGAVWMLSLVVSIVENDCSGLKAIDKAGDLMKGKRLQGFVLMLLFILSIFAVYISWTMLLPNKVAWIPATWMVCMVKLSMFVAYTVFYHECKTSHKEVNVEGDQVLYLSIPYGEA